MDHILELSVGDDHVVAVEVRPADRGTAPAGRLHDGVVDMTHKQFGELFEAIQPAVAAIAQKLRDLPAAPKEYTVEFGLKISANANAFIAATAAEGNFQISMTWRTRDDRDA